MTSHTSNFSCHRVAQLYQYNAPWIKKQTIIYFLFSLATALAYLLIPSETIRIGVYSPCKTILFFMFIWSPIVFIKGGDTRIVDSLIPASALEKFVFYMSYLIIVVGLACYLCPWIAEKISLVLSLSDMESVEILKNELYVPGIVEWSTILSTIAAMMTCFYFVIAGRRNRVVKAYLISVGVSIVLPMFSTFYGVKEAIIAGYKDAGQDIPFNESEISEMVSNALNDHMRFSIFALAINIGLILLLMWLSYRSLYRRNL